MVDRPAYGQCWEDADLLVEALQPLAGRTVLSIGSGGDNSLALLAEGPARLLVLDRNPAQIALLQLKLAAVVALDHGPLLEFLGGWPCRSARPGAVADHRLMLYQRCRPLLPGPVAAYWDRRPGLVAAGVLGAGRFERYLALVRRGLLPLAGGARRWQPLFDGLDAGQRTTWYDHHWDSRRWRWLMHLCFSRATLGRLGTDPARVRYGSGSQPALLLQRLRQVLVELDPADNPYLHWLVHGHYGPALPRALRPAQQQAIRRHRERLAVALADLGDHLAPGPAAGLAIERFNLSNVFEYLSTEATTALFGRLHHHAAPGARLVAWNRVADREADLAPAGTWRPEALRAGALHRRDRVFFYRRLVLAAAPAPAVITDQPVRVPADPSPLGSADERWQLGERAQAAIWWRQTPSLAGERVGTIGALQASDAAAAALVLRLACRRLAAEGCTRVLAPMDGSTWGAYRCRTGPALGFAGEPQPGPEWIAHLHRCGFEVAEAYVSRRLAGGPPWDLGPGARLPHLAGVALHDLVELPPGLVASLPAQIHRLVQAGFGRQPLFRPLPEAIFCRWLQQREGASDRQLTLLAVADGRLLGLVLAHRHGDDLVVRTLVVQPGRAQAGLGALLLHEVQRRAVALGCTGVIHALMHDPGPSLAMSRRWPGSGHGCVLMGRWLRGVDGTR